MAQMTKAKKSDPFSLVGAAIDVEGKGLGTVLSFEKTLSPATDSFHRIEFVDHGIQHVLLQRKKLGSWNKGLKYEFVDSNSNNLSVKPNITSFKDSVDTGGNSSLLNLPSHLLTQSEELKMSTEVKKNEIVEEEEEEEIVSEIPVLNNNMNELWITTKGRHFMLGNQKIILRGVSWFGFETDTLVPHGLWCQSVDTILDQIEQLPANLLRLPYCNEILRDESRPKKGSIDYELNPDLIGLTCLEILDFFILQCRYRNIRVILDRHRPSFYGQSELWYSQKGEVEGRKKVKEVTWIKDWCFLARRYLKEPFVIGGDLHNEPHGEASWGTNSMVNDWRLAAERCGNEILAMNPNWLIFVQGIQFYQDTNYWWGGNLKGAYEHPIRLSISNSLVYSAHDYPSSVYKQDWFHDDQYPNNLYLIWDEYWGSLLKTISSSSSNQEIESRDKEEEGQEEMAMGVPVMLGEFGTYAESAEDLAWLGSITEYIKDNEISFAYWCINPNSADTGGLLLDDWQTFHPVKTKVLKPLFQQAFKTTMTSETDQKEPGFETGLDTSFDF